jgi:hypothetical protein
VRVRISVLSGGASRDMVLAMVDGGWDENRMIGKIFGDREIIRQSPPGCAEKGGSPVPKPGRRDKVI